MNDLNNLRLLRLKQIIGDPNANPPILPLIPVSRSAWYHGIKEGIYPAPVSLGGRAAFWRLSDIEKLIDEAKSTV